VDLRSVGTLAAATLALAIAGCAGLSLARSLLGELAGARALAWGIAGAAALVQAMASLLGGVHRLRPGPFWTLIAILAVGLEIVARRGRSPSPASRPAARPVGSADRWASAGVAATAALVALDAYAVRLLAPGRYAYDDPSYHLTTVLTWLDFGDLRMPRFAFGDIGTCFYPFFGEAQAYALLAATPTSDFFARWAQLPAFVGALAFVAVLARELRLSRLGASLAIGLVVGVPRLASQLAFSAGNDLWAAFWILAAIAALVELARAPDARRSALLGAALGSLAATKYSALPAAALLGLVAIAGGVGLARRKAGAARPADLLAILVAAALASGAFAYVRNLAVAGNPVYPQPIRVAGWTVAPGLEAAGIAHRRDSDPTMAGSIAAFWVDRAGDLGWSGCGLVAAMLLGPVVALFAVLRRKAPVWIAALFALPAALFALFWCLLYDRRDLRYFAAGFFVAALAVAWMLERLAVVRRTRVGAAVLALVIGLAMLARPGIDPRRMALVTLALAAGAAALAGAPRRPRRAATAALALTLAILLPKYIERYGDRRLAFEPLARRIDALAAGRRLVVAYVGGNRPYFLAGRRLEHRVEIVPPAGDPARRHYDFGSDAADPFRGGGPARWLANLEALGVDLVAVDPPGLASRERRWLGQARSGGTLVRVTTGPEGEIWTWGASRGRVGSLRPPPRAVASGDS
jgi:hypothetical protein